MAMAAKVVLEQRIHRWRRVAVRQGHAQDTGWLVDNQQQVVLEENLQLAQLEWSGATLRTPRPVHPDTDDVPFAQATRRVREPYLDVVEEHLASLERSGHSLARPESIGGGEELIKPDVALVRLDLPSLRWGATHGSACRDGCP